VIVMLVFVVVFVVRAPVAEANFACEAGFSQDFQRSINGGLADRWILFLHESIQIFVRHVLFGAQKNIQDQVTLRRAFQPPLLDVFKKNLLLFA